MNAQVLSWNSSEKMGNNFLDLLPSINTDSMDSAIDISSFNSETWTGTDNNELASALEGFDFTAVDTILKHESIDPEYDFHNFDVRDLPQSLDLCEFMNGEDLVTSNNQKKNVREVAGRKKIDLQAQKYIIDDTKFEEDVDIETVTENPVLEARDIVSLLEQFESASQVVVSEPKEEVTAPKEQKTPHSNNKQIIEALPKELIERIKESGKRKRVELIDPFPSKIKKRKLQSDANDIKTSDASLNVVSLENIYLDHNYCISVGSLQISQSRQVFKKDSGYMSEEDRIILQNQPVVQNSDGKLMISLLKNNTAKVNKLEEKKQKKKLNIDEYKRRRFGITPTSSQSSSPISSSCSSPLPIVENEYSRRVKHEEKLRKMALEVLRTPPKSNNSSPSNATINPIIPKQETLNNCPIKATKTVLPTDMIVKTYVSVGINTDLTLEPIDCKTKVKIDSNSLINSIIENVPKFLKTKQNHMEQKPIVEHGEDKTIIYLPRDRKPPKTSDAYVQTSISLLGENKRRYRRRDGGSISDSSDVYCTNRSGRSSRNSIHSKTSRLSRSTSTSSSSSTSSRSSSSSSSSRSKSPCQWTTKRKPLKYDREHIQEVEERRVIYVGKVANRTTKEQLYRRFEKFGPIKEISLHFRNKGRKDLDNYGFVTFENKLDAYEAIEHGNDDPNQCRYDLSFGGRRLFCQATYADLDNIREDGRYRSEKYRNFQESFDDLLKEVKEKLKKRKA